MYRVRLSGMPTWTVDAPRRLSFEEPISRLDVYLISGRLNVVGTGGPARVEIALLSRPAPDPEDAEPEDAEI